MPRKPRKKKPSARKVTIMEPKLSIEALKDAASVNSSDAEMAALLGCSAATLKLPQYAGIISKCRAAYRIRLRGTQELLATGSAHMASWLGRNVLGQTDRPVDDSLLNVNTIEFKWVSVPCNSEPRAPTDVALHKRDPVDAPPFDFDVN